MAELAKEALSVSELFEQAVIKLYVETNGDCLDLNPSASSIIADDCDWHRARIGTMNYDHFYLVPIECENWLVSVGKKGGSYPGEEYECDIFAHQIPSGHRFNDVGDLKLYFSKIVSETRYFKKSILIGLENGNCSYPKNGIFAVFLEEHQEIINQENLYKQPAKMSSEYLNANLQPIVTQKATYFPDAAISISKLVLQTLTSAQQAR